MWICRAFLLVVVSDLLLFSTGTGIADVDQQTPHARRLQVPSDVNHTSGFWRSDFIDSSARGAFFVQGEVLTIGECYTPRRAALPVAIPTTAPSNAPSGVEITANPTTETTGITRIPSAVPSNVGETLNPTVEPTAEPSASPTTETAGITRLPLATASEQPSEEPTTVPTCGCTPHSGSVSALSTDAAACATDPDVSPLVLSTTGFATQATEPFRKLVAVAEQNNGATATLYYADYTDSTCTTAVNTSQVVQQTMDTVLTDNNVPLKVVRRFVTTFPPTLPGRYTVGYIMRYTIACYLQTLW